MERTTWTDERLDDLSRRMDTGFERVDRDIRDLRSEMRAGFVDVRSEINGLRGLIRMNVGLLVTVLAAVFLRGG